MLLTVAKARRVQRDGIRFQGLRYLDPTLAAYIGEDVVIRYYARWDVVLTERRRIFDDPPAAELFEGFP